ncbi:MAG: UTP--glucose-1-phosphate uridylyltransferase [Tissierellaceae bacterium]|nr:UTP--glucose-1-phosphate uridylyltransferase [Tissierellaceae bacterium]
MKIKKAVIPAAGLGSRFLPVSRAIPKEMIPIINKPTIHYIVEEAVNSGIEDILIIISKEKESITNYFEPLSGSELELERLKNLDGLTSLRFISDKVKLSYVTQKKPLGLGDAISYAKEFVHNEPFAVLLGDDVIDSDKPCIKQLMEVYERFGTSILGVRKVKEQDIIKYGNLRGKLEEDKIYKVDSLVEKPTLKEIYSNIAVLGRYIITPGIFEVLENLKPGKDDEIQLTDALNELAQTETMYAYEFEGRRYDLGHSIGFLEANIEYALRDEGLKEEFIKYISKLVEHHIKI